LDEKSFLDDKCVGKLSLAHNTAATGERFLAGRANDVCAPNIPDVKLIRHNYDRVFKEFVLLESGLNLLFLDTRPKPNRRHSPSELAVTAAVQNHMLLVSPVFGVY
jgi:hypothetical protein